MKYTHDVLSVLYKLYSWPEPGDLLRRRSYHLELVVCEQLNSLRHITSFLRASLPATVTKTASMVQSKASAVNLVLN